MTSSKMGDLDSRMKEAEKNRNIVIPSEYEMFLQEVPAVAEGLRDPLLPLRKL